MPFDAPSITPTDSQAAAIKAVVDWYLGGTATPQEFYLAGYAGVGKSTLVAMALAEIRSRRTGSFIVETGTFTGKAANVLRRKGVHNARTIHSMIYIPVEDQRTGKTIFVLAIEGPASAADLIVLDEVSMVNEAMAADVRSFGKKILVIGDPGQLPPVNGLGAFTNRAPDVMLREVHRQAADSPILRLATMARQGQQLPFGEWADAAGNVSCVVPHTPDNQFRLYRPETQPICGVHRVRWGYTGRIRRRLGFEGPRPAVGETLMCIKNDKDLGIFNGGLGKALRCRELADGEHWSMDVDMEDLPKPLLDVPVHPWAFLQHAGESRRPDKVYKGIQEFDFGYVLTCHKAQGSEWPDVTIVDDSGAFREDRAKWAYTAITRASERVTFLRRT
jgi:exodeoxyribonuclease-5